MCACGAIASTRVRRFVAELVGTFEIGISNSVVMPPAAAAAVPEAKSSRASPPGCRVCTCGSITPGRMCRPLAT